MKSKLPPPELEKHRLVGNHSMASSRSDGWNGAFRIPRYGLDYFMIICSDGGGWDHVSVHIADNMNMLSTPNWQDMCRIKDMFFSDDEVVVQFHPAKKNYVNNHRHTLHLWRCQNQEFPTPPKLFV